jgi:hypothetical protein
LFNAKCLSCACAILKKLNNEEKSVYSTERLKEQTASINRCWAKFAISLLKYSKNKLNESAESADQASLLKLLDIHSKFQFNLLNQLYDVSEFEKSAITSNPALDFEQARKIFLKAQSILNDAKSYFVLDGFVSDHCEIVRDESDLYASLLFFEADLDRRCKMQKRRLDLLIPVCNEINEQFYLQIKRQLLFDIASIYSEMMDTKIEIFNTSNDKNTLVTKEKVASVTKINMLASNAIEKFEEFLNTMKVQPNRKILPEKFDDHNVRSALLAKFYVGRLHSKIITTEPSKKLANLKCCFDHYKYLVDYCDKEREDNPNPIEIMRVEYDLCKEMITYLPAQMEKIRHMI